jgi:hypothetical protein
MYNARLARNVKTTAAALALCAAAATTAVQSAAADGVTGSAADRATLAHVRDITAKYRDVNAALADGYLPTTDCVASPDGGMGLHYVNPALLGTLDPDRPAVLLYSPDSSHPALMGAEWFHADADQNLATDGDRPNLFGHAFQGPMLGHEPGMPIHYDLHVWAWRANPSGDFSPWNPAVHCP